MQIYVGTILLALPEGCSYSCFYRTGSPLPHMHAFAGNRGQRPRNQGLTLERMLTTTCHLPTSLPQPVFISGSPWELNKGQLVSKILCRLGRQWCVAEVTYKGTAVYPEAVAVGHIVVGVIRHGPCWKSWSWNCWRPGPWIERFLHHIIQLLEYPIPAPAPPPARKWSKMVKMAKLV